MGGLFSKKKDPPKQPEQKKTDNKAESKKVDNTPATKEPQKKGGGEDDDEEVAQDAGGGDDLKIEGDGNDGKSADDSYSFWDRNKTFKPAKQLPKGRGNLHKTIQATMKATLGGGELRQAVKLPEGEEMNEWIAVNTVHFYNAANMIYGTCAEFCTEKECPTMCAGRNEYLWKDGVNYKKPTRVSAPVYIDLLLNWVSDQISDPNIFPVDEDAKFPRNFMSIVKNIYKRLFRLYAHIYWQHFAKMKAIGANAHLNTCFKHFVFFILEFNLVSKQAMAPLEKFIAKFRDAPDGKEAGKH
jgi:MOB kinase activator 1